MNKRGKPLRPQDRGIDRVAGGRFTKLRPEMVEHGRKVVAAMQAGAPVPPATDRVLELLTREFERVVHVGEDGVTLATAHGTSDGKRRPLTKRMQQILQLFAYGMEPKEIAIETGTSTKNVSNRLEGAMFCLDAKTKMEAVAKAVAAGLVVAKQLPIYETRGRKPAHNATKAPAFMQQHAALTDRDLSSREQQVLALTADGFTSQEIAGRLSLSLEQVKHSLKNLQTKLGVQGRIPLVAEAIRRGLIP